MNIKLKYIHICIICPIYKTTLCRCKYCLTGDSGSGTIPIWLWSTDELLVSTGLSTDAGTVFATCSILWSILWTTSSIYEQHEDACSRCRSLATDASHRSTPNTECTFATRPTANYGNIYHATPVSYAMKLIIVRLIVTYDIIVPGLLRKLFRYIPTPTFTIGFSIM